MSCQDAAHGWEIIYNHCYDGLFSCTVPWCYEYPWPTPAAALLNVPDICSDMKSVSLRCVSTGEKDPEHKQQFTIRIYLCGVELCREQRETLPGSRLRNMFITQLCKSVISTYEKVVTCDMSTAVIRWPMAQHRGSVVRPQILCLMIQGPPGL